MKTVICFVHVVAAVAAGYLTPSTPAQQVAVCVVRTATQESVNHVCPISGTLVDPAISTEWRGKTVAFCCGCCISQWNGLSEAQKEARIQASSDRPYLDF